MADRHPVKPARAAWRDKWYIIIFQHGTPAGRLFDIILLTAILLSVLSVILESVPSIRASYGEYFNTVEWIFTGLFTLEYVARLATAKNARRYALSFFGIVDLLAVAPIYLSIFFSVQHAFAVVRALRLLRVFRILKLTEYLGEAVALRVALQASVRKIVVFLFAVLAIVIIVGAMMYQIEGEANGFTSIPRRHVLGDRHRHHGRLRRHLAPHGSRAHTGVSAHDDRLRNHRRAHWNRHL